MHAAVLRRGCVTILNLLDHLPWLKGGADWTAWRAFLCAVYGLPMTEQEYDIFARCTNRRTAPTTQAREVWVPVGRRGRKSAIAALMGVYHAAYRDHAPYLAPGEKATIPILAKNKAEARQIRDFAVAILECPALSHLLDGDPTTEEIRLKTRVDIRIKAASLTAGRSKTAPLALLDEVAFFKDESSAIPDEDIVNAIRPSQATIPNALLVAMSSPYARRGILWKTFDAHFGREDDPILVWQADTVAMHDTPQIRVFVAEQYAADPTAAKAEYGAQFRTDLEAFVPIEVVRACTDKGVTRRPPVPRVSYVAFADPSGGTSDSMTLSIAHWDAEAEKAVQDCLVEHLAPFEPDEVVIEQCDVLREYGVRTVKGDHYAGEWPAQAFRKGAHAQACAKREACDCRREGGSHGERCAKVLAENLACTCASEWKVSYYLSEEPKSEIYREFLPLLNAGQVALLDVPRMHNQLVGLDRRVARGGRDSIDHAPGAHDDLANVTAGVLRHVTTLRPRLQQPAPEPPAKTTVELYNRRMRDLIAKSMVGADQFSGPGGRMAVHRRPRR